MTGSLTKAGTISWLLPGRSRAVEGAERAEVSRIVSAASASSAPIRQTLDRRIHRRLTSPLAILDCIGGYSSPRGEGEPLPRRARQKQTGYDRPVKRSSTDPFDVVTRIGLIAAGRRSRDTLRRLSRSEDCRCIHGRSGDPALCGAHTLVVRADLEERESFIEDAPETHHLTEDHRRYPWCWVRLERVTREALREALCPRTA